MNMFTICVDYNFSAEDSFLGFSVCVEKDCSVGGFMIVLLCLCRLEPFPERNDEYVSLFVWIRIVPGDF
jgi:hypothetical protein